MPTHLQVCYVSICLYNLSMSDLTANSGGQDTTEQRFSTLLQLQPGLWAQSTQSALALVQSTSMKCPLPRGIEMGSYSCLVHSSCVYSWKVFSRVLAS